MPQDRYHRRLVAVVVAVVVATTAGILSLWPAEDALPQSEDRPESLVAGTITGIERFQDEPDPITGSSGEMARIDVRVEEGPEAGDTVMIETVTDGYPDFAVGDEVKLSRSEFDDGTVDYFIVDFERTSGLFILLALFVVVVLAVSGWHGLRSLVGLGLSLAVVTVFMVPAILAGENPFLVALFGALAVMVITLYLAHGVNEMTTAAVVGTTGALAITIVLGIVFIDQVKLTGFASEEATLARFTIEGLDLQGLVLAGLIVAALGVLDDVTVSQASTVFALRDANPDQSWRELFGRAMSVGRDHIASTVNTLVLAYAGASLALLVLFATSGLPITELLGAEILAEEIVKTLVGSIGLITAVPMTTALAATLAIRRPAREGQGGHTGHAH